MIIIKKCWEPTPKYCGYSIYLTHCINVYCKCGVINQWFLLHMKHFIIHCTVSYFDSTSFLQYTVIGGSLSYGERRLVLRRPSRSLGLSRKSDIARTGVTKFRSMEEAVRSTRTCFFPGITKRTIKQKTLIPRCNRNLNGNGIISKKNIWAGIIHGQMLS